MNGLTNKSRNKGRDRKSSFACVKKIVDLLKFNNSARSSISIEKLGFISYRC